MRSAYSNSPKLLHEGSIVLLDTHSSAVQWIIPLQYNPDNLTRMLSLQTVYGQCAGDPLRPGVLHRRTSASYADQHESSITSNGAVARFNRTERRIISNTKTTTKAGIGKQWPEG